MAITTARRELPDAIISDDEIAHMLDRRMLVRMPRNWGDPPTDPKVMAELRRRVADHKPPPRRKRKRAA